jgi:hypothetical protein
MAVTPEQTAFVHTLSDCIDNNRGALNEQQIAAALFTGALSHLSHADVTDKERWATLVAWTSFINMLKHDAIANLLVGKM